MSAVYLASRLCLLGVAALGPTVATAAALLPPPPAEPELAAVYAQAQDTLQKLGSAPFPRAASAAAWPCAVDERQLRLWAGALGADEMDETERRNARRRNLDVGMGANEAKLTVKEPKLKPLSAHCAQGHLDGALEYVVDSTQERKFAQFVQSGVVSTHVRLTLTGGEPDPDLPLQVMRRETGRKTLWLDPDTAALMKKQRTMEPELINSVTVGTLGERGVTAAVTMSRVTGSAPVYGVFMSLPTEPGRREERIFTGAELSRVYRMKAGRLHGVQETLPIKVNGLVVMPAENQCFDEGEEVKVVRCDVE